MKKQYIQPTILVTKVAAQKIICSSPQVTINSSGSVNAGEVGSRDCGGWDDDE